MPWLFITNKGFNCKIAVNTGKEIDRVRIFSESIASGLQGKREESMAQWKSGKL